MRQFCDRTNCLSWHLTAPSAYRISQPLANTSSTIGTYGCFWKNNHNSHTRQTGAL
jgi:hypothetical protein